MAKICPNCKASLPDSIKFCTECGAAVPNVEVAEPVMQPRATVNTAAPPPPLITPTPVGEYIPPKGSKYDPITTGGYIGIMLLMCIPVVGIILTIAWALGACKKINKRNLARASLIMMAVALVISLIFGIAVKALIGSVVEQVEQESGISISALTGEKEEKEENDSAAVGDFAALLGGIASLSGSGENSEITNENIEELEELQNLLNGLEGITGEGSTGWDALIEGAQQANQDAEAANDGWPKSLRAYPGGSARAVASYRTEISDTSVDEMMGWIDELKKDGFAFKDFYEFGMSEADMLSMNSWWATDGEVYLSVSYYDGIVTIDHTKELPDLSSYFN